MPNAKIDFDQWAGLAANLGVWQGEFIRFDSQRQELSRVPSQISLVAKGERHIEQQLTINDRMQTLSITSLKRGLLFLPTGAFSQGSLQWSPFAEFGVELSLLADRARRRLVALYRSEQQQSYLTQITLIPEYEPERGPVPASEPWGGSASSAVTTDALRIDAFWQAERMPQPQKLVSQPLPYQCACALPLVLPKQQPFCLGLSWQLNAHEYQHIYREYDASGTWQSVCWFREGNSFTPPAEQRQEV